MESMRRIQRLDAVCRREHHVTFERQRELEQSPAVRIIVYDENHNA
jgi:hypothetical protein